MNDFLPLVALADMPDDLRKQWETTERPGLRDFIRMMAHAPDHFRRYNDVYGEVRFNNHLGPRVTELVRLAVAQTTRCQVCM
ncbi:MAG TPA: carboxymuconolactone decarboxylase family protein, partial [Acidimicrobiales bacterium]|nr:carboxymuconolactone decarboxylase family protein [Acidimicrobiales bacterium]